MTQEYSFKGVYGTLTLHKYTGAWEYVLDNTDADTIALNGGQTADDIFRILVTDEEGATSVEHLVVTVTGTDDAPVLGVQAPATTPPQKRAAASARPILPPPRRTASSRWMMTTPRTAASAPPPMCRPFRRNGSG